MKKPYFDTEKEYHVTFKGKKGIATYSGYARGTDRGFAACFDVILEDGKLYLADQLQLDFIDEEIYVD